MAQSFEGNAWGDYRWPVLLPAIPLAFVWALVMWLWRRTIRCKSADTRSVPKDAIIYVLHGDLFVGVILMEFFSKFSSKGGWLMGNHSFLSYVWCGEAWLRRWKVYRYSQRSSSLPKVVEFLKDEAGEVTFRLATDSGGPYGKVRASLMDMCLESGRPLVAIRTFSSAYVMIKKHALPLPFSRAWASISKPITPDDLRGLGREEGRELLQRTMDALA